MDQDELFKIRRSAQRLVEFLAMAPLSPPVYICREVRLIIERTARAWPDEWTAAQEEPRE